MKNFWNEIADSFRPFRLMMFWMLVGILAFVGAIVALVMVLPSPGTPHCNEKVCSPTWASDCSCYGDSDTEILPNGNVRCVCPDVAGDE